MSDDVGLADLDERVGRAMRELAPDAQTVGVFERVAGRRQRRETVRRRVVAGSLLAVVAIAAVAVSIGRDDSTSTVAAGRGSANVRVARGVASTSAAGRAVPLRTVPLRPDEGYVSPPLLASGSTVALASYERSGTSYTFPPSHVVRVRQPGGRVVDRVDLQGEILDLTDGEGARWALTHDKEVVGPQDPEFRVKRLGPDGSVVSNAVPPGEVPAGDLVAAGGGVWLPVRDAVLRFDPVTGALAARVPLAVPTERRGIASLGKFVAVTDGNTVRRLDPSTGAAEVFETVDVQLLVGMAATADTMYLLGQETSGDRTVFVIRAGEPATGHALPDDFDQPRLRSASGVTWIEADRRGRRVALLLAPGTAEVDRTLTLPEGRDVGLTFLDRDRLVVAADGILQTTRIDER